jgi:DNA-binding transcriptional LysR family regulator
MDASDLRIFEAVARFGGMNRAAEALNTVQSNVTARIRALEEDLGQPLFDRHARGVTLTAAGQRLLPHARRVQQALEDARRAVADDGTPQGTLTLGALETTTAVRLSPLLVDFAARWPAVDLVLRTGTTAELIDRTLSGEVEGAFVAGPVRHTALETAVAYREELVLLAEPGARSIDAVLARKDLKIVVLRAGCSYRQRLEAVLAARGVVGLRLLEFGTIDAILACVAAGVGVTLLPRALAESAGRAGRFSLHSLPRTEAVVDTLFVRRTDTHRSSALVAFLDMAAPSLQAAAE